MSESKIAVSVRIAGEEHVIRSSADPEHTRRCARLVDERIAQIRGHVGGALEGQRVAILAGLSLADELVQLREQHARMEEELAARARALVERVESSLAGDATAQLGGEAPGEVG
jgi:cell division protein ZapA (FtsZ GTPase activity inhibitor)